MLSKLSTLQYPIVKLTILLLLILNVVLLVLFDTMTSVVDQIVWLSLLIVYEAEVNGLTSASETTLNMLRNALIVAFILVFLSYAREQDWLDVINFLLWVALIALLEIEVRWPQLILEHPATYWWVKMGIFVGLVMMVFVWGWQSSWLESYDAALWIAAFFLIEEDIHQFLERKSA